MCVCVCFVLFALHLTLRVEPVEVQATLTEQDVLVESAATGSGCAVAAAALVAGRAVVAGLRVGLAKCLCQRDTPRTGQVKWMEKWWVGGARPHASIRRQLCLRRVHRQQVHMKRWMSIRPRSLRL